MNTEEQKRAFTESLAGNRDKLQSLIRNHINEPTLRADVYQDIVLEAWRSYPKFRREASFGTWVYRIALNVIYLYYRNRQKKQSPETMMPPAPTTTEGISPQAARLRQAIQRLPDIEKSMITAHLDDYSNQEISDIFGISVNYVRVKLHRIKAQLKAELTKN